MEVKWLSLFLLFMLLLNINNSVEALISQNVIYKNYIKENSGSGSGNSNYYIASNSETNWNSLHYMDAGSLNVYYIYNYPLPVYNVSSSSFEREINPSILFNSYKVYSNFTDVVDTSLASKEVSYQGHLDTFLNLSISSNISAEGKSNIINAIFSKTLNYTDYALTFIKKVDSDYEKGNPNYYGDSVSIIDSGITAKTGLSYISGYSINNTFFDFFDIQPDLKILTPYNLNDMVYVKNSDNNTIAIYVIYNGTEYLLTADTFDNYDVFYTDTSLLHRIQCGKEGEINLSSYKKNVVISYTSGNLILDADSFCKSINQVNSVPPINTTQDDVKKYLTYRGCGHIKFDEDNSTLNFSVSQMSSYTTIILHILYSNGTSTNILYGGDFNVSFNKSDIDALTGKCVFYKEVKWKFLGLNETNSKLVLSWYADYLGGLSKFKLQEYGWVVFFIGFMSMVFAFGRLHLGFILGIGVLTFFFILINFFSLVWVLIIWIILLLAFLVEKRWVS